MATQYYNGTSWVTPKMKVYDGTNWAEVGGGGILKSKQQGIVDITAVIGTSTSEQVYINEVDPNSSIIILNQYNEEYPSDGIFGIDYFASTTFRLRRDGGESPVSFHNNAVAWQVLEFENVKSKQTGKITTPNDGSWDYETIQAVDVNKCILVTTIDTTYTSGGSVGTHEACMHLNTSTQLKFLTSSYVDIYWQLIEFN